MRPGRVSVVGLGRLGAPMAGCLASRGLEVVGYDPVAEKVEALQARRPPSYEPGFRGLLTKVGDRLRATTDLGEAVRSTDATFVVVATPTAPDGSVSMQHVLPTCRQIGEHIASKNGDHLVVLTSTMMPGSTELRVRPALEKASGRRIGEGLGLCYGPLFATMGNVIHDFLRPDVALIGECHASSGDGLAAIYGALCENEPPVLRMRAANAELAKLSVNVFVATKISFANMIARLCELLPGGDVDAVTLAMQQDHRIGHGALTGAIAYGGPFFARDNNALAAVMKRLGVAPELTGVLGRFNRAQVGWLADHVGNRLPDGGCVGVLGLAYKPDSDILQESVPIRLCERLAQSAVDVIVHDPVALTEARDVLPSQVAFARSAAACIEESDLVVIATPWQAYRDLPVETWGREGRPRIVLDCWRTLPFLEEADGVEYVPLGIGPEPNGGTPPSA